VSRLTVVHDADQVLLAGTIDETAKLTDLIAYAKNGRLVLDLAGITFINSIGVREWCYMQQAAARSNISIELRRVAEPIVHQLNIVPAARGVSIVTSFYAPYECDDCDRDVLALLDVRMHGTDLARMRAPVMKCPDCDEELVFGHPPELYFSFLGS
jgi:anti-anti-sigma regulatory factor